MSCCQRSSRGPSAIVFSTKSLSCSRLSGHPCFYEISAKRFTSFQFSVSIQRFSSAFHAYHCARARAMRMQLLPKSLKHVQIIRPDISEAISPCISAFVGSSRTFRALFSVFADRFEYMRSHVTIHWKPIHDRSDVRPLGLRAAPLY